MTVPIWFTFTSSALPIFVAMPSRQDLRVGDEHVVADELDRVAERLREHLPALPVAFGEAVLDRDDRVLPQPVLVQPTICSDVRSASPDFLKT